MATSGMQFLQDMMNEKIKHLICKVTGKSFTNDFDQLKRCIECKQSDCATFRKVLKSKPVRRRGMTSEYDR